MNAKTFIASLLLAVAATAQPGPVALSKGRVNAITYTTADVNLFVDPTGSDSNPCTSTGTAACLTIQGAINKIPKFLRHRATVTVAAGNYAGFTIAGFTTDPSFQKSTMGLLIDGTLGNITPATGTATGTATAGSAGSGTTYGTLTDGAQTWTVNDLRGNFVVITAGTGVGQTRVICSNTGTVITICGTWTAPTGTSVYAIQAPTSIITSGAGNLLNPLGTTISNSNAGIQLVDNSMQGSGAGSNTFIVVRNMGTSGLSVGVFATGDVIYQLLQDRILTATGIGVSATQPASYTNLTDTYVTGSTPVSISGLGRLAMLRVLGNGTQGCVFASNAAFSSISNTQCVGLTLASSASFNFGSGSGTLSSSRCDCGSAATSACIMAGATGTTPTTGASIPGRVGIITGLDVTDCTYGIAATGNSSVVWQSSSATFSGNSLTYSVLASFGSSVTLPSAITITSGTADLAVDNGATTAAYGSLAAAFSCLSALGTGSKICRL